MLERAHRYFGMFKFPVAYDIDKELLKSRYYSLMKHTHPDVNDGTQPRGHGALGSNGADEINKAFEVLKDDFLRAKLFTRPSKNVSGLFLSRCLSWEEKLQNGKDISKKLKDMEEKCRRRYDDPKWLSKWAYIRRLEELFNTFKQESR